MLGKRVLASLALAVVLTLILGCASKPTPTPIPPTAKPPSAATAAPAAATAKPTTAPAAAATAKPTTAPAAAALATQNWIMATSREGSFGYTVSAGMARISDKYARGVKITVTPGYGTDSTPRVYAKGEARIAYTNQLTMRDMWANTGSYQKEPVSYRLYHGVYMYSSTHTVMTTADRNDIKSLNDLVGKKFFPAQTGSSSTVLAELVFGAKGLNIWDKIQERQMGWAEMSDAVKNRVVDAVWLYVVGVGKGSLSASFAELDLRANLKVVEPSAEEKAVIMKIPAISAPVYIDPKVFTKQVTTADKIWGVAQLGSYNFGPGEDEERAYEVTKAWAEHAGEMVAMADGFAEFAQKGMELTVQGIDSLPDIPVHPGIARYLKEKGMWKSTWKIGEIYARK